AGDYPGLPRIDAGRTRQNRVTRIGRPHRGQQDLVPAARRAERADPFGAAAERTRIRFQPADAEVDVLDRAGMRRHRRHAEVDRGDEDATFSERLRHEVVVRAVLAGPGAAVYLQRRWKRPGSLRPVQASKHARLVFDILDGDGGTDRI